MVRQVSRDQSLYGIWAQSSNSWLNYWRYCYFLHTLYHAVTLISWSWTSTALRLSCV